MRLQKEFGPIAQGRPKMFVNIQRCSQRGLEPPGIQQISNPYSNQSQGADYAPHTTTSPPGFKKQGCKKGLNDLLKLFEQSAQNSLVLQITNTFFVGLQNIGPHSARNVITHYFRQPNCFSKNNNSFSRWNFQCSYVIKMSNFLNQKILHFRLFI